MSFDSLSANIKSYYNQIDIDPKKTLIPFGVGVLIGAIKTKNIKYGILMGTALASASLASALIQPLLKKIETENVRAVLNTFIKSSVCYIILRKNLIAGLKVGSLFAIAQTASRIAHFIFYPFLQPKINVDKLLDMLNLESSDISDNWSLGYLDEFASSFVFSRVIMEKSPQSSVIQALFFSTLISSLSILGNVNKRLLEDFNKSLLANQFETAKDI